MCGCHSQKCIIAIAENAFKTSPYPVIITLENHTNEKNQKAMAERLKKFLGEKLYIPTAEDRKRPWKSPEELKGKVSAHRTSAGIMGGIGRRKFKSRLKLNSPNPPTRIDDDLAPILCLQILVRGNVGSCCEELKVRALCRVSLRWNMKRKRLIAMFVHCDPHHPRICLSF